MKKKPLIIAGSIVITAASLTLAGCNVSAPGLTVNSTEIGTSTTNNAITQLTQDLADNTMTINEHVFTYDDLGITYDRETLKKTLNQNNGLRFSSWNNKNIHVPVVIDSEKFDNAVKNALPDVYKAPVNAEVLFDEESDAWFVKAAENGAQPVIDTVEDTVNKDIEQNKTESTYSLENIEPGITNEEAQSFTDALNNSMGEAGFYIEDEEAIKISADQYNSMVDVVDKNDELVLKVDENAVSTLAATVPDSVNKTIDNGSAVVDENGKVLKTLDAWTDGYSFDDVDGLASQMIEKLSDNGNAKFTVEGTSTPATIDKKFRKAVVVKSERRVHVYENDQEVASYPVAIGKAGTETDIGEFHVHSQLEKTKMGCKPGYDYCTPNVKWVSYYNRGEGFHGTYWHNDFGNPNASKRSHGCVNMSESDAKEIYKFLQVGSPVSVVA